MSESEAWKYIAYGLFTYAGSVVVFGLVLTILGKWMKKPEKKFRAGYTQLFKTGNR